MKNIVILLLVIICFSCRKKFEVSYEILPLHANNELNTIDIIGNDTLLVAGGSRYFNGDIYISYDAGVTWKKKEDIIEKTFYTAKFETAKNIYAVGYDGRLMISNDYGTNFSLKQMRFEPMKDLEIFEDELKVCSGNGFRFGAIYRLTKTGQEIQRDTFPNELRDLLFISSSIGFCCGYGIILKTIDGGLSWQKTSAEGDFYKSIQVDGDRVYFLGSSGSLIYTDDKGVSFKYDRSGNKTFQSTQSFNQINIRNGNSLIACDNGKIYFKNNGTWRIIKSIPNFNYRAISISANNYAYAVSEEGKVIKINLNKL
jgi:photosystem II stability/assembly factor-like uncharacterized protein